MCSIWAVKFGCYFFIIQIITNENFHEQLCCLRTLYIISLKLKNRLRSGSIQIHDLSPLISTPYPRKTPVSSSFNLTEINPGRHPATRRSRLTVQEPDGRPCPEFNFNEIKSQSLMEILLSVHH